MTAKTTSVDNDTQFGYLNLPLDYILRPLMWNILYNKTKYITVEVKIATFSCDLVLVIVDKTEAEVLNSANNT